MEDNMIFEDIKKRGDALLSYYHIFAYAATSRKDYRQGKYEGFDFALLIFTVISCIENLHISQKECTKKEILNELNPVLLKMGVTDIDPEALVNEVITNCLENNGSIIKKESFIEEFSPSVNLISSKNINKSGTYVTEYKLTTLTLNMLYSTKEFFDIVSQSNIIIKKQLKKGNIGEAIREAKSLRSTISIELDEVDRMIDNIRNNIYTLDVLRINARMKDLLDEIIEHQKETSIIIASIDSNDESIRILTEKDKVLIKAILNEVSKMEILLLTNIQECITLLDDNILNFDFITNHNNVNIYNDIILPLEKDRRGVIQLDKVFAPLLSIPKTKLFNLEMLFVPQAVPKPKEESIHYIDDLDDDITLSPEQHNHTKEMVNDCSILFYTLLDALSDTNELTLEDFISVTPYIKEKLGALRLLAFYLFTSKDNKEESELKLNLIDGDYHTSVKINETERSSFSILNEFFMYPKRTRFIGHYIVIEPEEKLLTYQNDTVKITIPNMKFTKVKKEEIIK